MEIAWVDPEALALLQKRIQAADATPEPDQGYVVCCDYGGAWGWVYRTESPVLLPAACGMGREWSRKPRLPRRLVRAFSDWQARFEYLPLHRWPPGVDSFDGFSWRAFHVDGLKLARHLKRLVGPGRTVIYARPWEDLSGFGPRCLRITDDLKLARYAHLTPKGWDLADGDLSTPLGSTADSISKE